MSEPTPGPDDNPDALLRRISLEEAYVCPCGAPLVVCEKNLLNSKAGRRFFCICPLGHGGFKVIASLVMDGVQPTIPKGGCVFNFAPHRCTHFLSKPEQRNPRKRKKK